MKYKYNKNAIQMKREEDDGTALLILRETQNRLVINKTGKNLLNIVPDFDNDDSLLIEYQKIYPDVDERILKKDIYEILKSFELFGLIEIVKEDDIKSEGIIYGMVGDVDYKKVSAFIIKSISSKSNNISNSRIDKSYFSPVSLRARTMKNKEYGVFCQIDDSVKAYISISFGNMSDSNVITINHVFMDKELDLNNSIIVFSGMINHMKRYLFEIKQFKKIRMSLVIEERNKKIIEFFNKCGFLEECILKEETIHGDLGYFTLFI